MVMIPPTGLPGSAGTTLIGQATGGTVKTVADTIGSTADFLKVLAKGSTWIRVLLVVGGIILLLWGLIIAVQDTKIGKAATEMATKAAIAA